MNIYRYIARAGNQKTVRGLFRALAKKDMQIASEAYKKLHNTLPLPFVGPNVEFWFTEDGYRKFGKLVDKVIKDFEKMHPDYIKEFSLVKGTIEPDDSRIEYQDKYQIAIIKSQRSKQMLDSKERHIKLRDIVLDKVDIVEGDCDTYEMEPEDFRYAVLDEAYKLLPKLERFAKTHDKDQCLKKTGTWWSAYLMSSTTEKALDMYIQNVLFA